jgi:hypothetical protein
LKRSPPQTGILHPFVSNSSSQKYHITDSNATPILSTNPDSPSLTALSHALISSNAAIQHLSLGRIKNVRAEYANGEVVQTAKLNGTTGVVATVVGKQVRRSVEVERIVGAVHGALEGNGEQEQEIVREESAEDLGKRVDSQDHQWDTLAGG